MSEDYGAKIGARPIRLVRRQDAVDLMGPWPQLVTADGSAISAILRDLVRRLEDDELTGLGYSFQIDSFGRNHLTIIYGSKT